MIIGRFSQSPASGAVIGHIRTLVFEADKVVIEPVPDAVEPAPAFRVCAAGGVEFGAAWPARVDREPGLSLDVSLDAPGLAAPIRARLLPSKTHPHEHLLIWTRRARSKDVSQTSSEQNR